DGADRPEYGEAEIGQVIPKHGADKRLVLDGEDAIAGDAERGRHRHFRPHGSVSARDEALHLVDLAAGNRQRAQQALGPPLEVGAAAELLLDARGDNLRAEATPKRRLRRRRPPPPRPAPGGGGGVAVPPPPPPAPRAAGGAPA